MAGASQQPHIAQAAFTWGFLIDRLPLILRSKTQTEAYTESKSIENQRQKHKQGRVGNHFVRSGFPRLTFAWPQWFIAFSPAKKWNGTTSHNAVSSVTRENATSHE